MSPRINRLAFASSVATLAVALTGGIAVAAGNQTDPLDPSQNDGNLYMHRNSAVQADIVSQTDQDNGVYVCRASAAATDVGAVDTGGGYLFIEGDKVGTFDVSYRTCPADISQPESDVTTFTVNVEPTKAVKGTNLAPASSGGKYRLKFDNPNQTYTFDNSGGDTATLSGKAVCLYGSFKNANPDGVANVGAEKSKTVMAKAKDHRDWVCYLSQDGAFAGDSGSRKANARMAHALRANHGRPTARQVWTAARG